MSKLFGTDGARGIVGKELNATLAFKIGASTAKVFKESYKKKLIFLVGTDTRISKDILSSALISGVLSENANVIDLKVLPTPALSYLVQKYKADGAFVISASHNPSEYNGIKVLDSNGIKISEEIEEKIEEYVNDFKENTAINTVGTILYKENALNDYVNYLKETITENISHIKILLDVANGASYETANLLFTKLNANYKIINNNPDGLNINENCGSTHIENLKNKVTKGKFDIGISYDGDADRVMLVDHEGNVVDGDFILAIASKYLNIDSIVGTVMSNLGLIKFCEKNNIKFISTKVGDKYVLEEMLKNNYTLGGEQSGHIIFKNFANTGDGELSSLQILNIMAKHNKSLKELASIMEKYPQVNSNIEANNLQKEIFKTNNKIKEKINEYENLLGSNGRIVARPSGTENLIRIMFEGNDINLITKYSKELCEYIKKIINE
ncbi:MAG: phosphoglucosamine mutase [Bacilli bacterium]|nr:phosphoglucosamine mutase [Bacilli bacterium]